MSEPGKPAESYEQNRARFGWRIAGLAVVFLSVIVLIWSYNLFFRGRIGPKQPIPFSHRVHVGVKAISCLICHNQVIDSARAGIPPVETCMLCHSRIIVNYPPIEEVRRHYARGEPIIWEKVFSVPEFVYFNHSLHIHRGIDCGKCHGNIGAMDRVYEANDLRMGFCIECHRQTGATHDCFTCHR